MRKQYTKEFKKEIVTLYENGIAAKQIPNKFALPRSILYEWIKLYKKRVDEKGRTFTYREFFETQKKAADAQLELEVITKTQCLPSSSRMAKLEAIEKLFGDYPVKKMCRVLDINHATFYNYHYSLRVEQSCSKKLILMIMR